MADKVTALMLAADAVASPEPQVLAGIAGRWEPGVAYLPDALGLTERQAVQLVVDLNLPLQVVKVDPRDAEATFRRAPGSHAPSVIRPVVPASTASLEPVPVVNDQGDVVYTPPVSPPNVNPPWVEPHIAAADRARAGEPLVGDSPITAAFPGVPLPETPDVGLTTSGNVDEGAWGSVEAPTVDYRSWKLDELRAEVDRRGLTPAGRTKQLLADQLDEHDHQLGVGLLTPEQADEIAGDATAMSAGSGDEGGGEGGEAYVPDEVS